MKILTKDVRKGKHNGKVVWICHYLRPDLDKKPLRNVPPTKVLIRDNDETIKRIYYSASHFVKFGKNDKLTKQVISPVDNTGYRTRPGNELHVFDNEKECILEWNKQVQEVAQRLDVRIHNIVDSLKREKSQLEKTQYELPEK